MPNVLPFPSRHGSLGEVVELAEVRAGLTAAATQGMPEATLQAVLDQDRPLATHALQLLGSQDPANRRHGSLMLSRMADTLTGPTDELPTAA